ncbi:MAG: efflux RND transporter periplasmic adaptor subunit, partial [Acidobacteriota bacterium]
MSPEQRKLDNLRIDRTERRERKSGAWVVVVIAALALIAAAGWWLSRPTPAKVRTATVRESTGLGETAVLNASGYVTARRKATVSSKITGKVVEVLIEEGVEVTEGQVLARLDSSNVGVALSLTEAELEAGRSALAETRVRLEEARLELRRVTELVAGGVASQAELDGAQAEVDSLK